MVHLPMFPVLSDVLTKIGTHSAKSSVDWSLKLETLKPGGQGIKSPTITPSPLMNGYNGSESSLSLNLDNSIKPPSPTYSPARGVPPSAAFSLSPATPGNGGRYLPTLLSANIPVMIKQEKSLSADELYNYINDKLSILFVDIRFRETYDEAHIAGDAVCIEPIVIHEGYVPYRIG